MTLTPTRTLLQAARARGGAVGAFNVVLLETAEALAAAAEAAGTGVILQISQNCAAYHGGVEPLARAVLAIAESATAPVAVHLDHAEDAELARRAVDLGFGSVMYDGAALDIASNMAATASVVAYAHAAGVAVEAELGEIGGKNGAHAFGVRTDPDQARLFVAETGVDALAVAVGSSHAMVDRTATIDLGLVARLREAVPVPLVLHGSSGVPDAALAAGIAAGLVKINVSTHFNAVFTTTLRAALRADAGVVDPRKYIGAGRTAVADEAARLLRLFWAPQQEEGGAA